jgi:hypothetical protein
MFLDRLSNLFDLGEVEKFVAARLEYEKSKTCTLTLFRTLWLFC